MRPIQQQKSAILDSMKVVAGSIVVVSLAVFLLWICLDSDFGDPSAATATIAKQQTTAPVREKQSRTEPGTVSSKAHLPASDKSPIPAPTNAAEVSPVEGREQRILKATQDLNAAVASLDVSASLASAKALAELDNGNSVELRADAFEKLTAAKLSPVQLNLVAREWLELLEQAITEGRTEVAIRHKDPVLVLARKTGDPSLIRRATLLVLTLQKAHDL